MKPSYIVYSLNLERQTIDCVVREIHDISRMRKAGTKVIEIEQYRHLPSFTLEEKLKYEAYQQAILDKIGVYKQKYFPERYEKI